MSRAWKYLLPGAHRVGTSVVLVEPQCKLINHQGQEEKERLRSGHPRMFKSHGKTRAIKHATAVRSTP